MDEIELLKMLDYMLSILKDNKRHSINDLSYKMQLQYPTFTFNDAQIYSQKLFDDKLIQTENSTIEFRIKFEGRIFIGYENQRILQDENIRTAQNNVSQARINANRLLWATWSAGIFAGLLLIWQVWIWFYPIHANYPYWIWETIPKKHK